MAHHLEQRYPELAEEFTLTADLQQATTGRHRKEVAKRFLTRKAEGLVPKGYQIDQFLGHVKALADQRRPARGRLQIQ